MECKERKTEQPKPSVQMDVVELRGAGKQIKKYLSRLKIFSIHDLLFHFPLRYQDRTKTTLIRELIPGNEALVEGIIQKIFIPLRGKSKVLCELSDGTGKINLRFFNLHPYQLKILKNGAHLRCFSEVRLGSLGLEMIHPEFQVITHQKMTVDQTLTPVYPTTEGLSQYWLRKLTTEALLRLDDEHFFPDMLPKDILQTHEFPTLKESLKIIHRPPQSESMLQLLDHKTNAQKRLIFEELLVHRMAMLHLRNLFQKQNSFILRPKGERLKKFFALLPFELTPAQLRVIKEIQDDLNRAIPMLRLLQGDVGSGKTVIAAMALLQAVENGYQAALMAPTELLAEQHYRVLKNWFEPLGVEIAFLSGKLKSVAKNKCLERIAAHQSQIILGTHALFQEKVNYPNLALIVVDEQHRFGVEQRTLLSKKGLQSNDHPHQLIMTATPIPRTLAMSFYADLDCSTIDELPPGRIPITTSVMPNAKRDEIIVAIRKACGEGRQTYWVCPLIDDSDVLSCESAIKTAEQLQTQLPELKIGLIHGRLLPKDKEHIMAAFQKGDIHLLVATTVIEVGVDVPNATIIVIENAERLGLAQLHQLRGRVGRGTIPSHCILLYQPPLSDLAQARLKVIKETNNGFKIAERDLELRGPGEVLGTKQTGALLFRVADLVRDSYLLSDVQKTADFLIRDYPGVSKDLISRWFGEKLAYGKS